MAESGEGEEVAPRGNDWEVVSLTASAYAAAPGPKAVEEIIDGDEGSKYEEDKVETSRAMFMSRHFYVPVGLEIENSRVPEDPKVEEFVRLQATDASSDDALDAEMFVGKESAIGSVSSEVQESLIQPAVNTVELKQSIDHSAEQASAGEASFSDVKTMISELTGPSVEATADGPAGADVNSSKQGKDKKKAWAGVPCVPWWKKQAASLYDHVKEANPLWSIVIAAAVMGLAFLGHRWQQRKSHVSPLKLQFNTEKEKPGKVLGPMTRLKEALVSGNHGSGSVRSHISSEI